jgi:hypothetical protein
MEAVILQAYRVELNRTERVPFPRPVSRGLAKCVLFRSFGLYPCSIAETFQNLVILRTSVTVLMRIAICREVADNC